MGNKQILTILEGLLYVCGEDGLTLQQAANVLQISERDCEVAFDDLSKYYLENDGALELLHFNNTYKIVTKDLVYPYIQKLFAQNKVSTLSPSALETLAIIAYKQPITRVEIEELRGVGADMMLRKLLARNLIKEQGRSDAPGRPILYEVTDEFMDSFKLLSLDELPDLPTFESEEENENLFE